MAVARSIYTRPFDLECDPPCQVFVLAWSPHAAHFLLHMHHIVSDGWSMQVILKDLRTAYERAIAGKSASLPPLALQYSGYKSWKRATVGVRSTAAAGRQVRFVAHSYSGSVLHEMLRVANECEFDVGSIVLVDSMPHDRLSKVGGGLLETWRSAYGFDRIAGASEVVAAALAVPYVTDPVKIEAEAILVIGDRSAGWLDPGCWNAYFASVRTIRTPGDHLSLVRSPDCERWLERLFPDPRR